MGTFAVKVTVLNSLDPSKSATVECLVDTGAAYSQLPSDTLDSLGITHFDERPCIFADGRRSMCRVGRAEFTYDSRQTPALVIFGESDAPALLGAMTLSAGIAGSPEHASAARELLRAADVALFAAKQAGRNRVVTADTLPSAPSPPAAG